MIPEIDTNSLCQQTDHQKFCGALDKYYSSREEQFGSRYIQVSLKLFALPFSEFHRSRMESLNLSACLHQTNDGLQASNTGKIRGVTGNEHLHRLLTSASFDA